VPAEPDRACEKIATAQARRDRQRLVAAQAELEALRLQLAAIERSATYRALAPARRGARFGLRAARALQRRWRRVAAPHAAAAPRGRALVIDANWPQPDRDSGSVDIFNMVRGLERLGFEVILAADKQHDGIQPAREALRHQSINCLTPADAPSVGDFIAARGGDFDLVVLCRVFCGGEFLEAVQRHCMKARVIFNSIDLNFLREERKALLLNDARLLAIAQEIRPREEHIIRSTDATIVVSEAESRLLAETLPESLAVMMPLARAVTAPSAGFAARRGIGFIGGFAHAPNVDAMRYFLAEIWPAIHQRLPDCPLSIVGADAPGDLIDGAPGDVSLRGHVPDIAPWFETLRLTVAPLRFGAGAKGKVASSLAAGVPCIATAVAAEGMALNDNSGVIVAETPAAFAEAVIAAYQDEAGWAALSAGSHAYATRVLSLDNWQAQLNRLLIRIGL